MKITVYDGADTIGGNKIHIEDNGKGLFLDFGLNFAHSGMYFKEFIKMRPTRGLNDPFEMGLLPKVNTYRGDLITDEINRASLKNIPVDAILLTHAHMDHYGMIGYLNFDIPLVASPETLAIIKASQDSGRTEISGAVIYDSVREESESALPILKNKGGSIRTDLEKIRKYLRLRNLIPTEPLKEKERRFLYLQSTKERSVFLRENMNISSSDSLPFKVRAYPVDHSIYGSVGYIIEAHEKKITYTGDLRIHGERGGKTMQFAEEARGSDVLIIEGTRLSDDREQSHTTEKDVYENCSAAVGDARKLFIADFSARNFERLNMFAEIAIENGRQLVVTEKDAYAIMGLIAAGTNIKTENMRVYEKPSDRKEWWQKITREDVLWKEKYVTPINIRDSPTDYILAFSLYDMPNMMDIKTYGGMYLYSSTEAFNEDMELDFAILNNWLKRYDMKSIGFSVDDKGKPSFEKGYHASGHAAPEDLKRIIDTICPEIIIPVHTENPLWFRKNFDNTKIIRNGESKKF